MKTEGNIFSDYNTSDCELEYFNGSLCQFASGLLSRGRGEGCVCRICGIPSAIVEDMKSNGLELLSNDIIVTQRQIFKYRKHPKTGKGANIPVEDYAIIESALKNPMHIYEDTVQKRLVYVCTHPYHDNRLVKVVVEPNYKSCGRIVNLAKSWGIVQHENMRGGQYRLIR
ncbi:MAG: hypothetical protein IKO75_08810 [Bacteroidales bacterium]|nr:hypothetical protein [Bacteroidales bacterium]